jgi:hypothetical protein
MVFLNPVALTGLLALAIPILIHLFHFRRYKKVVFTNVHLLEEVRKEEQSFRNLRQWLVLLFRLLAILGIVLAFAKPVWRKAGGLTETASKRNALIYLDNSYSMQTQHGNQTLFEWSRQSAQQLIQGLPPTTRFRVWDNTLSGLSTQSINRDEALQRAASLSTVPFFRSGTELTTKALQDMNFKEDQTIYLFSDFQKSTFGELAQLKIDSNARLVLVPIQESKTANLYLDSVWFREPYIRKGENATLLFTLRNAGDIDYADLAISLKIDGVQTGATTIQAPANKAVSGSLQVAINWEGAKRAVLSFEDKALPFDNSYNLMLQAGKPIAITHIYDGANSCCLDALYGNDSLFQFQSFSTGNVDYGVLEKSALIIVDRVKQLSPALETALLKATEAGASLCVLPSIGNGGNVPDFLKRNGILIKEVKQDTSAALRSSFEIRMPDNREAFFEGVFLANDGKVELPYQYPTWDLPAAEQTILRYTSGKAFMIQRSVGKGRIFAVAAPLEALKGTLSGHSLVVPLFYRLAFTSVRALGVPAYRFNNASIRIPIESGSTGVVQLAKDKQSFVPAQISGNGYINLDVSGMAPDPGFYEIRNGAQNLGSLAFNTDVRESQPAIHSAEELRSWAKEYPNVEVWEGISQQSMAAALKVHQEGLPLWKYCLILALIALLAEILVIRFLLNEKHSHTVRNRS